MTRVVLPRMIVDGLNSTETSGCACAAAGGVLRPRRPQARRRSVPRRRPGRRGTRPRWCDVVGCLLPMGRPRSRRSRRGFRSGTYSGDAAGGSIGWRLPPDGSPRSVPQRGSALRRARVPNLRQKCALRTAVGLGRALLRGTAGCEKNPARGVLGSRFFGFSWRETIPLRVEMSRGGQRRGGGSLRSRVWLSESLGLRPGCAGRG